MGDVEYATAAWVDWYNNRRLHGTLGMMTPVEYEAHHYATLNPELHPRIEAAQNLGWFICFSPRAGKDSQPMSHYILTRRGCLERS